MSQRLPGRLAGSVRWAVAPYAPAPPFRLFATGRQPYQLESLDPLVTASRCGGDAEFAYLVSAKARPVLILTDPSHSEWQEVVALRLRGLASISDPERQERIRQGQELLYVYLQPSRFELPEENAVLLSALVPINVDAIASGGPLGVLNEKEMRVVGERLVRHFNLDIRSLVERRIHEIAGRRQQQG